MAARLTTFSLAGIAGFTGLVGLEHVLRPDYDPIRRYVREYAVGRYHEVMTVAFFSLAVGSAALLVDLTRTLPAPARSTGGLVCLGIWSGAIVVAGLFSTVLSGRRFRRDPIWRAYSRPSLLLGILQFSAVALTLASPGSRKGIAERLLIALDQAWLVGTGLALRTRAESH